MSAGCKYPERVLVEASALFFFYHAWEKESLTESDGQAETMIALSQSKGLRKFPILYPSSETFLSSY